MTATCILPEAELAKHTTAMRTIAVASGRGAEEVMFGFAGVLLKTWAGRTKVRPEKSAIISARSRAAVSSGVSRHGDVFFGATVNTGRQSGEPGLLWFRTRKKKYQLAGTVADDGAVKYSWLHYAKEGWDEIKYKAELYARNLAMQMRFATRTVALARQSVVQIADGLGIDLLTVRGGGTLSAAGIAKARAALNSKGVKYINGTGRSVRESAERFFIELLNIYPNNLRLGMDATLAGVIAGQNRYFEKQMEHGVFNSQARTVRAYPFLQVSQN